MTVVYVDFLQSAQNIGQLLQMRAQSYPYQVAVRFLKENQTIDYATLHRRAKTMAAYLQQIVPAGASAILMYTSDIDYICALFACFYSGVTVVPVLPIQAKKDLKRLKKIMITSNACLFLSDQNGMQSLGENFWNGNRVQNLWPVTTMHDKATASMRGFHDRVIDPEMIAILDYGFSPDDNLLPRAISHRELLQQVLQSMSNFNSVMSWLTPISGKGSIIGLITPSVAQCTVTPLKMVR